MERVLEEMIQPQVRKFKHLMTGLMVIFNKVLGLHLHQRNWKHLSFFILEGLDPIKTEITAVVTDLDTSLNTLTSASAPRGPTERSITRLMTRPDWMCERFPACFLCRVTATVANIHPKLNEKFQRFVFLPAFLPWLSCTSLAVFSLRLRSLDNCQ